MSNQKEYWINKIHQGDTLEILKQMPSDFVDTIITSPPYWSLRNYNVEGQIGLEPSLSEYLEKLLKIFIEIKRVMKPTGVFFLNWGDCYASNGTQQFDKNKYGGKSGIHYGRARTKEIPAKCLVMQNYRGILMILDDLRKWELRDDLTEEERKEILGGLSKTKKNIRLFKEEIPEHLLKFFKPVDPYFNKGQFLLRNSLVWFKNNAMPSSVKDRFSNKYEPIFMLVKNNETIFWINKKIKEITYKKPLGIKGVEGIDWDWDEYGKKKSNWIGRDYFFDLDSVRIPIKTEANIERPRMGQGNQIIYNQHRFNYRVRDAQKKSAQRPQFKAAKEEIERYKKLNKHELYQEYYDKGLMGGSARIRSFMDNKPKTSIPQSQAEMFGNSRVRYWKQDCKFDGYSKSAHGSQDYYSLGKNCGDVWQIDTQPCPRNFRGTHFACVDKETEAMTPKGWKKYNELKIDDKIAVYNPKGNNLEWGTINDLAIYEVKNQEMLKIGNRDLDILLTPNHRCLIRKLSSKLKKELIKVKEAKDLSYSDKIPVSTIWQEFGGEIPISKEEYAIWGLTGWFLSEGIIRKDGSVEIYQSKPEGVKRIEDLLKKISLRYIKHQRKKQRGNYPEFVFYIPRKEKEKMGWFTKQLEDGYLQLSYNQTLALFNGLIGGDGSIRKDDQRISFIQKDKEFIDRFQILAIKLGYHCIVSKRENDYCAYLTKRKWIGIRNTNGKGKNIKKIQYQGIIWCPQVQSGYWLARRNGRPFITGNSFPEKLVEPMILAATPKEICKKCGKIKTKITKSQRVNPKTGKIIKGGWGKGADPRNQHRGGFGPERPITKRNEIGFTDCGCNAGFEPGIVLDPFVGLGTTCIVAKKLGRRWIGVDISEKYCKIAEQRIKNTPTPLL